MTVSLKAELKLDEEEMTTGPDGQAQQMQLHEIMDIKREFLALSQELKNVFQTLHAMNNLKYSLKMFGTSLDLQEFQEQCVDGSLKALKTIFQGVKYEFLQQTTVKM